MNNAIFSNFKEQDKNYNGKSHTIKAFETLKDNINYGILKHSVRYSYTGLRDSPVIMSFWLRAKSEV